MNKEAAITLFSEVKALWDCWSWNATVEELWLNELRQYEQRIASNAVQEVYRAGSVKYQRDLLPSVRLKIRAIIQYDHTEQSKNEPFCLYSLQVNDEPILRNNTVCCRITPSPDWVKQVESRLEDEAEERRAKLEARLQMQRKDDGVRVIVIRHWHKLVEPQSQFDMETPF